MAGILPVAINNDKIYFLLSRETVDYKWKDSGKWSDFGGSIEKGETIITTAIREGCEETMGMLGNEKKLEKRINENLVKKYKVNHYTTYVIQIDYDKDFVRKFRKKYKNVLNNEKKKHLIYEKNGLYEKDMVKWVELKDIKKFYPKLRNWYKYVLKAVVKDFNKRV